MNYGVFAGRLVTVPNVSLIPLEETESGNVFVCKFVICTYDSFGMDYTKGEFFECLAFEDAAKSVTDDFRKGDPIVVAGKIRNFAFKDANDTPHFTQVVLVEHVEQADYLHERKRAPVLSDIAEMDRLFSEVCSLGFLCIDEKDYVDLAISLVMTH